MLRAALPAVLCLGLLSPGPAQAQTAPPPSGAVPVAVETAVPAEPAAAAAAEAYPPVVEIAFEGNEVTRPSTMLRELVIAVGDPADPQRIEKSRQALLDLGLFKKVVDRQEAVEGGVRVVFKVDERYYFFPLPRADAKADGQYSYGVQVAWDNVLGLNHRMRVFWVDSDRKRQDIGKERTYSLSYSAPFIGDSPYGLNFGSSYTIRPVETPQGYYEETLQDFALGFTRTYSKGAASQGWTVGAGLKWSREATSGPFAEPEYGDATAPYAYVRYRDFHYHVFSETGRTYSASVSSARDGWGSDYSFTNWNLYYADYLHVGRTEHQTVHFQARVGAYFSGPERVDAYGIGGPQNLRGYETNFIEGNGYYRVALEYARPLRATWPWLRGVVILEGGNVFDEPEDISFDKVYTSLGLGLRIRLTNFVDVELEAGWAVPLNGGPGRYYGGRV
ncbi:MAG: POTRA domain-containing protein [Nevskiales bacterium]|nr:POTRA domain-containing protein [Nevskiales bacterium]